MLRHKIAAQERHGRRITVASTDYDRVAMRAMIIAFRDQPLASRVLLSDTVLVNEGLCRAAQGHLNHAHFEVGPPARA